MPRKHGSYTCRHGSKATSHAYSHITSFVEKYVPRLPLRGRLQLDRDCHCIEILAAKAPHLQDEVPIPRAATYSGCLNVPGPVGGGWGGFLHSVSHCFNFRGVSVGRLEPMGCRKPHSLRTSPKSWNPTQRKLVRCKDGRST